MKLLRGKPTPPKTENPALPITKQRGAHTGQQEFSTMTDIRNTDYNGRYNGWTNRETWCANLWLSNEYLAYKQMQEIAAMCGHAETLADHMKIYIKEAPEFWKNDIGDINAVDYLEIAGNWLEA